MPAIRRNANTGAIVRSMDFFVVAAAVRSRVARRVRRWRRLPGSGPVETRLMGWITSSVTTIVAVRVHATVAVVIETKATHRITCPQKATISSGAWGRKTTSITARLPSYLVPRLIRDFKGELPLTTTSIAVATRGRGYQIKKHHPISK